MRYRCICFSYLIGACHQLFKASLTRLCFTVNIFAFLYLFLSSTCRKCILHNLFKRVLRFLWCVNTVIHMCLKFNGGVFAWIHIFLYLVACCRKLIWVSQQKSIKISRYLHRSNTKNKVKIKRWNSVSSNIGGRCHSFGIAYISHNMVPVRVRQKTYISFAFFGVASWFGHLGSSNGLEACLHCLCIDAFVVEVKDSRAIMPFPSIGVWQRRYWPTAREEIYVGNPHSLPNNPARQ